MFHRQLQHLKAFLEGLANAGASFVLTCRVKNYREELSYVRGLYRIDLQDLNPTSATLAMQTGALTLADLELVETFLHRRLGFDDTVRRGTARRIVLYVEEKLKQPREAGLSDEDFLQNVAKAIRDNNR